MGSHSLEDGCGPGLGIHAAGPFHQPPGGHNRQLGIGPGRGAIGYFITYFDFGYSGADGVDHASALNSDDAGQGRSGVNALAAINIGKVHTGGLYLDHRFALTGSGVGHVLIFHDFGATEFCDLYCLHIGPPDMSARS